MDEKKHVEQGTLYIIATPIGNLEDITFRAVRVLKEVDLIAAEDTRHTRKLLNAYGIQTPLTSLYDWNERTKSVQLLERFQRGTSIAYVSDAGTPGVSDPGYVLIREAIKNGIRVVPVPGASAVLAALCVSGLPMDSFVFNAFLPASEGKKRNCLISLREEKRTMVFYESPRRLKETLEIIREVFGDAHRVVIARELTKIHEEVIRKPVAEVIASLEGCDIRGEITLLIEGVRQEHASSEDQLLSQYDALRKDPMLSTKDIVELLVEQTGQSRKDIYRKVMKIRKDAMPGDL